MKAWRVVAGYLGLLGAMFAIVSIGMAKKDYDLAVQISGLTGRPQLADDPATMAIFYASAALVAAALSGSLICFAFLKRPVVPDFTEPVTANG